MVNESPENGEGREVLGILYIRSSSGLGPMLGDSAFTEEVFRQAAAAVERYSPWLECSFSLKRLKENGPAHFRLSFDYRFSPTLTYNADLP